MSNPVHSISYRAHIDGLRAIAVLSVIFYHADIPGFVGGFVGVDVFFVISGFLITSVILRDLRRGVFSLASFWEKRIRRIFPALIVMMVACVVAAYFFMLWPADFHNVGKAVVAQSVFASNMLFMISDNYFDQPSRYSPLLHTWTLSVEEQFYVLFPLVIMASLWLTRRSQKTDAATASRSESLIRPVIIVLGIASFALSFWLVDVRPGFSVPLIHDLSPVSYMTAGFYLLPSRVWELAIGVLIALFALRTRSFAGSEFLAFAGVGGVLAPVYLFTDSTPFPGIAALLPTLGAAGIIIANEERPTLIGRALASLPLVSIGVISYSLYLWHWPVLVFSKIIAADPISFPIRAGLIAVTFVIAFLSYRYVETPFRSKRFADSRKAVFGLGIASMAAVAILGLLIFRGDISNLERIPASARATLALIENAVSAESIDICSRDSDDVCRVGKNDMSAHPEFVLWGDSHAAALLPLVDTLGKRHGVQGAAFTQSSCIPVWGIWSVSATEVCREEQKRVLSYIEQNDVRIVFLVAHWNLYVMGGRDEARSALATDSNSYAVSVSRAFELFESHLSAMLQKFADQDRVVYIMKQVPEQPDFEAREAFYRSVRTGQVMTLQGVAASTSETHLSQVNSIFMRASQTGNSVLLDPSHILCESNQRCAVRDGDTLLYRDDNHVSEAGAAKLEPLFVPVFVGMRSRSVPGTNVSE